MNDQKGVLRSTTTIFLLVGLVGIWMGGCEKLTQEQKVEKLIKKLQDQNVNARMNAVRALGKIGTPEAIKAVEDAIPFLIQQLQSDQDKWVRMLAAMALGPIGEGAVNAVPALIQALQDQDISVRYYAAYALGSIGEGAVNAVPTLRQAFQDPHAIVRQGAAEALEKIGTPEALKAVEEYQSQQQYTDTFTKPVGDE